jgi:hypothetical protein
LPEKKTTVASPTAYSSKRKARAAAADSPLDTAALLAVIVLIGMIIFLLWT